MPIQGSAASGYSFGEAMEAAKEAVLSVAPAGETIEWSGQSREENNSSSSTMKTLAMALVFAFLCRAALYESWKVPFTVIFGIPTGFFGASLAAMAFHVYNDIYFQIGLLTIIGLAAKNAILIVEFAKDEVEKGRDILTAVILAARLRFRPIVMTSLAFILGMLPLVFASGPGSASRQGIGTGVFFGMLVAITVGIVFVPLFFVWVYKLKEKWTTR